MGGGGIGSRMVLTVHMLVEKSCVRWREKGEGDERREKIKHIEKVRETKTRLQ